MAISSFQKRIYVTLTEHFTLSEHVTLTEHVTLSGVEEYSKPPLYQEGTEGCVLPRESGDPASPYTPDKKLPQQAFPAKAETQKICHCEERSDVAISSFQKGIYVTLSVELKGIPNLPSIKRGLRSVSEMAGYHL